MFRKILIANRGEIALRIIRACKELGIKTIAVYSEADRDSLHVHFADEDICIGPADAGKSYLNIPSIISAAEITDAEAIHPGYGFLSENSHFAEICESCKIKFIGPNSEIIKNAGNKYTARRVMIQNGISVIPGSKELITLQDQALEIANEIGYPVIIKAAGGGGGKGMRIAHTEISLLNALMSTRAEAKAAFGSEDVYIEKYIEEPRHIEVQILADEYGNIIHLGERDCSVQRRHQKLLEQSPAPLLDEDTRIKISETALKIAKTLNYISAGTIEFLVDKYNNYYFIEINTRVQVEHPVTEMVTGIDIIKQQILIASGEKLGFKQEDVKFNGHAIECRINAEDPENDFIPHPGQITKYYSPGGPGVRLDSHVYQGYTIPPFYDSMIAKLITHGSTRQEAIKRMERALDEFLIEGIKTTIPFHKKILSHSLFQSGKINTHFISNFTKEE
ncbi:MAG: acetyl-CoA carboxylase biotin carboxylase subunit [Candidatus Firestonebacteria bacterium]|nr:acetyl-CoA carboxylase biotin carboxylase subunit [Candidatus Firestonebacteria bacterium]